MFVMVELSIKHEPKIISLQNIANKNCELYRWLRKEINSS